MAQQLYTETEQSIEQRALLATQRKMHNLAYPEQRPSKKDRRDLHKFKQANDQLFAEQWADQED